MCIRVHPTGVKSFVLRLSQSGRVTDVTLGHWPDINLKQARQKARNLRKSAGLTPCRGYILRDAFGLWKGLKRGRITSFDDERRRLEKYIITPLGNCQLDEISAPQVIHIVKHLDSSGRRATLKRVLMRLREILDLAVCAGYIQHNPIDRVSKVFPPPVVTQMPAPNWRELQNIMTVFKDAPNHMKILFLWSLCSMLRPGENCKIRLEWIEGNTLTIPACEMKKGRAHRVPLTQFMNDLIAEARRHSRFSRSRFLFPSRLSGSKHISSQALAKFLHNTELKNKLVAHGLRSIARSWMADNSIQYEVAEACLAHLTGSNVSRSYQRSDFFEARRDVMRVWCVHVKHCAQCAGIWPLTP